MGDKEITANYCFSIITELEALERMLMGEDAGTCYECDYDRDSCTCDEFAPGDPDVVEVFEAMREHAGEGDDYTPNLIDYLNSHCLEFTTIGEKSNGGEWTITGARILRTFGGPNCWITWRGDSLLEVSVRWGGETVSRHIDAPITAAAISELVEL